MGDESSSDVDDVRTRMTEEVANLRSVLRSVRGSIKEEGGDTRHRGEGGDE